MPLTDIEKVRSLIGDMNKASVSEYVAKGDGQTKIFQLDMCPIRTGSESFTISGKSITSATISRLLGTVDFTATNLSGSTAPTAGAQIIASYQYNALSDDEIQFYLDVASGNGVLIAGAFAARGLASNFARFFAYSQGDKSVDKKQISKSLLDIAESLEKAHGNALTNAGTNITLGAFHDSGTAFDGYDTASAVLITATS